MNAQAQAQSKKSKNASALSKQTVGVLLFLMILAGLGIGIGVGWAIKSSVDASNENLNLKKKDDTLEEELLRSEIVKPYEAPSSETYERSGLHKIERVRFPVGRYSPTVALFSLTNDDVKVLFHPEVESCSVADTIRRAVGLVSALERVRKDFGSRVLNFPVAMGDGYFTWDELPRDVSTFSRAVGTKYNLIPNLYLLQGRCGEVIRTCDFLPKNSKALFEAKRDVVFFRGSDTGFLDLRKNTRVRTCIVGKTIPMSDIKLSEVVQFPEETRRQIVLEGILDRRIPFGHWKHNRYILDIDGNSSSWDRAMSAFHAGSLCVRVEPRFEEHWHLRAPMKEICLTTSVSDLPSTIERARANLSLSAEMASRGRAWAAEHLTDDAIFRDLADSIETWNELFAM